MIKFDEKNHKYFGKDGQEYESVTKLLGKLFPFNRNEIAKRISKNPNSGYYKWALKDIFADWSKSAVEGNKLHHACEVYLKENTITDDEDMTSCVEQFSKLRFKGNILSEQRVYSTKYLIAGTVDILEECKDIIYLYDIKTYKKITNDRIHKLNLQLEVYRRLTEERFNKPCKVMGALVFEGFVKLKKDTPLIFVRATDVKAEVNKILENRLKEITK